MKHLADNIERIKGCPQGYSNDGNSVSGYVHPCVDDKILAVKQEIKALED